MTNYPTTLDDATSLPVEAASTALSVNHVTAHQNVQDAIEAIEAKVGVDSSAVTTSHDYKLSAVTGSDKALKSGTSTQSVTGLTLASPKITVGSDAVGDLHYVSNVDGTQSRLAKGNDNQILKMNGTALNWEDEITTVNASTTVAGIVELATTAQVTAGTATGETGAALVVTPDGLAASTPVFNGSGITSIPKRISTTTTDVTVVSTTSETNLLSQSIAGGTLSTANYIRAVFYITSIQTNSTAQTCTIRVKYGATTLVTTSFNGGGGGGAVWSGRIEVVLAASGATGTQNAVTTYSLSPSYTGNGNVVAATFASTAQGTSSEDSTAAKTFAVTAQMSNNSASDTITAALITLESVA